MAWQDKLQQLNLIAECRKYRLSLWQCPQFIFLMIGLVIIVALLLTYFLGTKFISDPLMIALVVLSLTAVLLVLDFIITQSFERLAEVARMRSDFIGVVSHQIRTPLTNLRWTLEALMSGRAGKIQEEQVEYIKLLKENSERMADLVADLLTVSRLETGPLAPKEEVFSLDKLIREIVKEFSPFARARHVKIRLATKKDLPRVWADLHQVKQVIENLLDNAIRYIKKKGEVKISLSVKPSKILCQIRDTGLGIPEKDQKYIFKKFFRADNALRYQTQGSGLGLFIAKAIIDKTGGEIGFKSEENKGSTFWFTLPVATKYEKSTNIRKQD